MRMLGKAERKKEREVDSSAYERTEVLNKSLRNRNQRFTAADPTIHIFINLTIVTFLEID